MFSFLVHLLDSNFYKSQHDIFSDSQRLVDLHELFLHCRLPASDLSVVATSHNEQKGSEVEIFGKTQAGALVVILGGDWLFQIFKTC